MSTAILIRGTIAVSSVLAVCLPSSFRPALAAPGSWTRKADMPKALDAHASCEVDGILYVIGGHEIPHVYRQLATLYAYDPKTDAWTRKADMPTARRWPAACALDGIIYVIGGGGGYSPPTDAVEAYDPKTDTWVPKSKLPQRRWAQAACAVDGIIYAIGGGDANLNPLQTLEAYDPQTDRWTSKAKPPQPIWFHSADVVDGLIYTFDGRATFAYDPKTNRWTRKATILDRDPSWDSYGAVASAVDGIVYLFGGEISPTAGAFDLSLAYDPVQDKFTVKRKMPMKCLAAAAATIGGKIYHTGGTSGDPDNYPSAVYYDSLWVFDPQGGVMPQLKGITCEGTNGVRLAWQGEAGRLYSVESIQNLIAGRWTRAMLSTRTNSILATNALVEAITVPSTDSSRFFRVLEAN